jgi:hypothetical protein
MYYVLRFRTVDYSLGIGPLHPPDADKIFQVRQRLGHREANLVCTELISWEDRGADGKGAGALAGHPLDCQ